ncbi:MAG: ParM/StbA family protein [Anaerolineales bacterium]|nr:ParM/StbA family protein [Anaerolineales bacterium]
MPSAVARPHEIGLAARDLETQARPQTVTLASGLSFVAGAGAWAWGEPLSTLDFNDLTSPQRLALFYATLSQLLPPGYHTVDLLVVGLPVPLLQDELQAKAVMAGLAQYKKVHEFAVDNKGYSIEIKGLRAFPQPVGAYADWMLNEEGHIRQGGGEAEVAILDIGMNTLDLYAIQNWKVAPRFVGGGKLGIRRLLENMNPSGRDLEELDSALRAGNLQPSVEQKTAWLGAILGSVERTWSSLRRFDVVIPTGGGAVVLGELLRSTLAPKSAAVHWPADPVTANGLGFYKWGRRVHRNEVLRKYPNPNRLFSRLTIASVLKYGQEAAGSRTERWWSGCTSPSSPAGTMT